MPRGVPDAPDARGDEEALPLARGEGIGLECHVRRLLIKVSGVCNPAATASGGAFRPAFPALHCLLRLVCRYASSAPAWLKCDAVVQLRKLIDRFSIARLQCGCCCKRFLVCTLLCTLLH